MAAMNAPSLGPSRPLWLTAYPRLRSRSLAFLCVRVSLGETLFPVHAAIMSSEVEFTEGIHSGSGPAFADEAFKREPFIAFGVSKGCAR